VPDAVEVLELVETLEMLRGLCRLAERHGRRMGGQGAVVFAQHVQDELRELAIKFFFSAEAFKRESDIADIAVCPCSHGSFAFLCYLQVLLCSLSAVPQCPSAAQRAFPPLCCTLNHSCDKWQSVAGDPKCDAARFQDRRLDGRLLDSNVPPAPQREAPTAFHHHREGRISRRVHAPKTP
jgi:hypothetical protein